MSKGTYDAVIVGARVAGAATGLLLARGGARVLLIDREAEIGDTLSTHALMRPAVELLAGWGLLPELLRAGTPWVRQAQFQYGSDSRVVPIRAADTAAGLIAPRRWLLDSVLLDAAAAAGAEVRLGTVVTECIRDAAGRVEGVTLQERGGKRHAIRAELVIGADGRASRIAERVGAKLLAMSVDRATTVYGYFPGIPNRGYRWFFGSGVSAGVIPTNGGLHCVFAACRPADYKARFADARSGMAAILLGFDPEIAVRLAADAPERLRRFPGAPGHLRERVGEGWALVGDAACFKDPATAHGITDALLDACALANCIARAETAAYAGERHAQSLRLFEISQKVASFDWRFDELQDLHAQLNACMKEEHTTVTAGLPNTSLPLNAMCSGEASFSEMNCWTQEG